MFFLKDKDLKNLGLQVFTSIVSILSIVHLVYLSFGEYYSSFVFLGLSSIFFAYLIKERSWETFKSFHSVCLRKMKENKIFWITTVLSITLFLPAIFVFDFYDKVTDIGHFSTTHSILNGHYPPLNIAFPDYPFHYHIGIDLFASILVKTLGVSVQTAFKLLTLASVFFTITIVSQLFSEFKWGKLLGKMPFLFILISGMPYLVSENWVMPPRVNGSLVNPNLAAYFFQAPWLIGIPCAFLIFYLYFKTSFTTVKSKFYLFVMILALSFSQELVSLVLSGSLFIQLCWDRFYQKKGHLYFAIFQFLFAVITVIAFSGTFGTIGEGSIMLRHEFLAGSFINCIKWNVATFGVALLGIIGFFKIERGKVLLFISTIGSIGILNILEYKHSWDIVKFGTVAYIPLAIGFCALIDFLLSFRIKAKVFALLLSIVYVFSSIAFLYSFSLSSKDHPYYGHRLDKEYPLSKDMDAILTFLKQTSTKEMLYTDKKNGRLLAIYGGIPLFHPSTDFADLFLPIELLERRREILKMKEKSSIEDLKEMGLVYYLVDRSMSSTNEILSIDKMKLIFSNKTYSLFKL